MEVGVAHFLAVSAILFTVGVFGIFLNRRNVIVMLMSIELILLAVNINFVAFSAVLGDLAGQVFALFVMTVAAAEAAIGLAILVVFFQFWMTRRLEKYRPMLMMAAGSLLYAIGFAMYGFVSGFVLFVLAMIVITVGEMVVSPFQQSLVAGFAPEDMRGRYMAVSELSWSVAFTINRSLFRRFDP